MFYLPKIKIETAVKFSALGVRVSISPEMQRNQGSKKDIGVLVLFLGITNIIISVLGID